MHILNCSGNVSNIYLRWSEVAIGSNLVNY
jgi:hypothetical protein